jgi:predicted RNA binding protein YcfA (HicA-like mRNA interferase family)
MPRKKVLSGDEIIKFLQQQGFEVASQKGSHVCMVRSISLGKQTVVVPRHTEIKKGTLNSIINSCRKYISAEEVQNFFFTK